MTDLRKEFPDVIPATDRGGYLVASQSTPGAWWFVECVPGRLICACPAGWRNEAERADIGRPKFCRHGRRLLAYIDADRKAHARPTAPPNISALCD